MVLPPVAFYLIVSHMPRISQPGPRPWWGRGAEIDVSWWRPRLA